MSKLDRRVEMWGMLHLEGETDHAKILTTLFVDRDQNLADLCRLFEVSRPAMTACLRRHGLDLKSVGQTKAAWKAQRLGYADMAGFFEANWKDSFREMASKLGLSIGCVRKEYADYKAAKQAAKGKKDDRSRRTGPRDRAGEAPGADASTPF